MDVGCTTDGIGIHTTDSETLPGKLEGFETAEVAVEAVEPLPGQF